MAGTLSGNVFGGGSSIGLGGFLDDLFGDTEDVAGDTTGATTAGTPQTVDGTIIPGTPGSKAKQSPGALPKFGPCPSDMIDDPLNPKSFCVPKPGVNFACPPGQMYDYARKPTPGCAPLNIDPLLGSNGPAVSNGCPYGTKRVGRACVSMVGSGGATLGSKTPNPDLSDGGPAPNPIINALGGSGIPTWAIALAGLGVVGIVGAAIYAKSKGKQKGRR